MRNTYGDTLLELGEKDKGIVLIVGDLGFGHFDEFKRRWPERYFNFGACEQSMVSAAAGMALEGLKPYLFSISPFLFERPFEQIKIGVDSQRTNVKLVGYADYPDHGPTHATLDWRQIAPVFVNTSVYFPETRQDVRDALLESYASQKPTLMFLKRARG